MLRHMLACIGGYRTSPSALVAAQPNAVATYRLATDLDVVLGVQRRIAWYERYALRLVPDIRDSSVPDTACLVQTTRASSVQVTA
eukprot:1385914-Rhodomonas_salina.1